MRIFLLFLLAIVLINTSVKAQETNNSSGLVWGLRLGMNWATIKSDFDDGLSARTSGVIGVFTRHKLNNSFLVQPEINYTLKGGSSQLPPGFIIRDYRLSFDFFEFPVLLRYNFGSTSEDRFKPDVFLGPFLAFRLSSTLEAKDISNSEVTIKEVKSNDYGLAFGTSMGFKIDNVDILIELRYSLSLTSFD